VERKEEGGGGRNGEEEAFQREKISDLCLFGKTAISTNWAARPEGSEVSGG